MKWIIEIFLVVAALAVEMTVQPTRTLSIILFVIAGLAALALAVGFLWRSDRAWKAVSGKLEPHLAVHTSHKNGAIGSNDKDLASAVDDLLDELNTIDGHLDTALATGVYGKGFYLPAEVYHQHKHSISESDSQARSALGGVYVDIDQLNKFLHYRGPGEVGRVGEPIDAEELRRKIDAARSRLADLRPS